MKMRTYFFFVAFASLLTGCASRIEKFNNPTMMYKDHTMPMKKTGVVILRNAVFQHFHKIDQEECEVWRDNCNFWIRVLPGKHHFEVYLNLINQYAFLKLEGHIEPKHTYLIDYKLYHRDALFGPVPEKVKMALVDLGENATVTIGMNAWEKRTFTPKFD